ncbi:hypothetical protein WOLCODRAFT_123083 [Wolfiporia cocos MD-104 SS10]|uniref:Peptidase S54 rhomboid domain-containing protein n=1 Tax=Wolfiporia cocos (strain MD-104) TaxID=742152 RepID=A0A2H3JPN7_WOLCO|nr:hypothetical protein WOLCODRAFT_123083 [Wolfiporia cocos MD-104 SS10]
MRKASYRELGRKLQARLTQFQEAVSGLPQDIRAMAVYSYAQVAQSILNTTEGSRMCYAIGALNGAILLAWQIPRLTPVMMRAFTHSPLSGLSYTMLTCVFSHSSFLHYLFNTMALASFGSAATSYLTTKQQEPGHLRESTSKWHFLAFFVSAGLFSSAVSHVITARITYPQLVSRLTRLAPSLTSGTFSSASTAARSSTAAAEIASTIKPSLGASGAIYATVTLTAMAYPDTHITLIFPPTPPIPIQYGVFGLMAVDVLGILRGWKLFDHYAHLGGALFGIWYHAYGPQIWESFRVMTLGSLPPSLYP